MHAVEYLFEYSSLLRERDLQPRMNYWQILFPSLQRTKDTLYWAVGQRI
jgi:hypothetical protein